MNPSASQYECEAILQDGSYIRIRALRSDDKDRLLEYLGGLRERWAHTNVFHARERWTQIELGHLLELDYRGDVSLAATLGKGEQERIVGLGRYSAIEDPAGPPHHATMTMAVTDEFQERGIGTLLLEHLISIARANGIITLETRIPDEDARISSILSGSGFNVKRLIQGGVVHLSICTEETEEHARTQHSFERQAIARAVRGFVNPKAIAVVGASRQSGTIGAGLVVNLRDCKFTGPIYPVNPNATEIHGLRAYKSVSVIGAPVDLALIAVPARFVEGAIRDCARAGVRSVIAISAGFGEVSAEGREAENRLTELVRTSGMRMIGPNCMGVVNTDPQYSLNATFVPAWPPAGNIGMLSQSGAVGYVILDCIQSLNIGLSTFVSIGNNADITSEDILAYWADDPCTDVVAMYLEGLSNPRKLARIAPDLARQKPILAVKAGRSAVGMRAASSHTAALASLDAAVDALFEQAGVIRTNTLGELVDAALLLATQPVPPGNRVGVISNAGGPGILFGDTCEARGLVIPELTRPTIEKLRWFLPSQAALTNPVDMIAAASPEQFAAAIQWTGADPNIDAVVVIYVPPRLIPPEEVLNAIARAAGTVPAEKPVLLVFMSFREAPPIISRGKNGRLPCYTFPENAALALVAAARYGRWRQRRKGKVLTLDRSAQAAIRAVIDRVLATADGPVWLSQADVATILRAAGIDFAAMEETTPAGAASAAERLGFPLVLKVNTPRVIHKSDVGGVILGLRSRGDLEAALDTLGKRMEQIDVQLDSVLLQQEIQGRIEAFVGVTVDPTIGPIVALGLGGLLVELAKDVSFRLPPISDIDAEEMLDRLRARKLLDGYRGNPPGDHQALIQVVQRVSALVGLIPELGELDINPIKVLEPGRGAIAVDARMRIAPLG